MRDGNYRKRCTKGMTSEVVSLPMRDGNSSRHRHYLAAGIVVSLPMRDGNVLKIDNTVLARMLLAYL